LRGKSGGYGTDEEGLVFFTHIVCRRGEQAVISSLINMNMEYCR
jgi:pyridoxine/pyridoxamine 5'-phosphate oxidase